MAEDIYKVSLKINGKNQDIDLNEFNKKGYNGYAQEYPDAVIRMRNKDNEDYAIPLSEYKEAYDGGLRPYVIRQKVYQPKPKSVKQVNNKTKQNANKPGEVALQVEKESGLLPTESTPKNKVEKENPYTSAKPFGFEGTRLYSYINHDNYGDNKVNDFKRETDDLMKVDVSRGYPQAVDLADETMRRTMPVFSNIVSQSIKESKEKAGAEADKELRSSIPTPGSAYLQAMRYNKKVTPSAIFDNIKNKIAKDQNFANMIREESARLEIDPKEYATRYALPTIQKILYNQLIEENIPKSTAEYVFSNAMSGSILGMLVDTASKPLEQRQLESEARGKYNASKAEDVASTVASIAMDLPVMGVTGGLGNAASKTLLRGQVNRMMSAGLTREAAEGIATRAAQQTGMKWGLRSVSEGVNFGAYEGLGNVLSQLHTKDEIDASEAGTAMAKGMITGAAMGIFGVGNESIGRALSTKIGDKASQAATYATSLGGRTAILAGSSVLGQWASDPNFNADNINWTDEFIHAGLTNLGFDIIGAAKRIGKSSVKSRDINLTKEDIRQLNEAGINGSNAKEIAESIIGTKEASVLSSADNKPGLLPKEWSGIQQEYNLSNYGRRFGEIMSNENIDLATKSKIGYLMTGQLYKLSPSTGLSESRDENTGEYIIDTYNTSGQRNERRRFSTADEAAAYKSYAESEVKRNQAEALEDILNASSKTRASIDVFNSFVDEGISKDRLLDVYSRGKNGEKLSKEDKSLFERINTEIDNSVANDSGYGVLKAKNIIMQAHGLSESEFNKIRSKSYNRMSDAEKQIYDDYLDAMRDVANPSGRQTSSADMSSQSEQARYFLGNDAVEDTNNVNVPDGPSPSFVKPSTQNVNVPDGPIARGKQKALEDYDGGNFNAQNVREYSTHIEMAGQRLARYFNNEQVNDILNMDEGQLSDYISTLPIEQQQAVEDFIEAITQQNELDRLAQEHIDNLVDRDNQLAQSMTGEIPGKVILATYDGKDYVVLNGYANKTGEYMAVPIERGQDGYIDFTSFNPDNASAVKMPGAKFREFSHDDIYTPEQTEAMERYNNALDGQYNVGDNIRISVDGENILNANVLGVVTTDNGAIRGYVIQVDGENKPVTVKSEEISELTQNAIKADYTKRYAAIDEQLSKIKAQQKSEGTIQVDENTPVVDDNTTTEGQKDNESVTDTQEVEKTKSSDEIPVDEAGEPLFYQVPPERTIRFLQEESGFTPEQSNEFINTNISELTKALSKAEKNKPKIISRYSEYKRKLNEWESEYGNIKTQLDYWTDVQSRIAAQKSASAQPQQVSTEDEKNVPDMSVDKASDARNRGFRMVNGFRVDRQPEITGVPAGDTQVRFSTRDVVPAEFVVMEAEQVQPSHVGGTRNPLYFITEAQPKERTDKASQVAAERIAKDINPQEITSGGTAYTGAPVVNGRGEVIQGNNRASAIKTMYAEYPDSANKYREYVKSIVEGSSREAVDKMKYPVLVRSAKVPDEEAIKLGQMTAKDTESGGKERIEPKQVFTKLGDSISSFSGILLRSGDDDDKSISELITENGIQALKFLASKKVISDTQYQSAIDKNGNLTPEGKQDLFGILENTLFDGGIDMLPKMFESVPAKAQKAILQTFARDMKSPEEARIKTDIQKSIEIFYDAMQDEAFSSAKDYESASRAIDVWKRQKNMYTNVAPQEIYSNFAIELAVLMKSSSTKQLMSSFNRYYDLVQGQKDLFSTDDVVDKDEALKRIFNVYGSKRTNLVESDSNVGNEGRPGITEATGSEEPIINGERRENRSGTAEGGRINVDGQRTITQGGDNQNTVDVAQTVPVQGNESKESGTESGSQTGGDVPERNGQPGNAEHSQENSVPERNEGTEGETIGEQIKSSDSEGITGRSLSSDEALRLISEIEATAVVAPQIELTRENWDKIFGETGIVNTPIGEVKMGENQFTKLMRQGRNSKLGMIKPTLETPDIIIEDKSKAKEGDTTERDSSYVYVKFYIKPDGSRNYYFTSVTVCKDGKEVVISNQEKRKSVLANLLQKGKLIWKRADNVSSASDVADGLYSSQVNLSEPTTEGTDAPQTNYISSENKYTNLSQKDNVLEEKIEEEEKKVDLYPTDAQKEAGNYKKGHLKFDGLDFTIENVKGGIRSGKDRNGKEWSVKMNNTYGYIRGTEGVDGDHIDMFISEHPTHGNVYVIDQVNPDGTFDEHKVMYGFPNEDEAKAAYLANYSDGWKGLGNITEVSREEFKKWIDSSKRKTKPFNEYKSVKPLEQNVSGQSDGIFPKGTNLLPKRLREAYESGDKASVVGAEQALIDYIDGSDDLKMIANTYFMSKDLLGKKDILSPSGRKMHNFISKACKDTLNRRGVPLEVFKSEKYRIDFAGKTDDSVALDIMSFDKSVEVVRAVINNPHTSDETLKYIASRFNNNGLDWETRQILNERNGEKDYQKEDDSIRFRLSDNDLTEESQIINDSKQNGTFMKAPNGKDTNLTEKQWVQVRTKAFKDWFGDWEKAARIEKLRKSEPVRITGKEIEPSNDLKQYKKNALEYGKSIRGEYKNKDTGEIIHLTGGNSRGGIREILQHDYKDIEHLQSIAAIPKIIENAIFIDELPNEDKEKYNGVSSFRYYVCGLNIGGEDYTVKSVIAVQSNGDRYYDHKLTSLEKGKLLDQINDQAVYDETINPEIQKSGNVSEYKDKRLYSLLQVNSSKVVDENGEPKVVYHGSSKWFTVFNDGGERKQSNAPYGSIFATDDRKVANSYIAGKWYGESNGTLSPISNDVYLDEDDPRHRRTSWGIYREGGIYPLFMNLKNPLIVDFGGKAWNDLSVEGKDVNRIVSDEMDSGVHDGVIVKNVIDVGMTDLGLNKLPVTTDVIAFDSNHVKSATENTGEFSSYDLDIRFRFIGEKGASRLDAEEEVTTRLDNLSVARDMERKGKSAKSVKLATGWERGSDGLWRYETLDIEYHPKGDARKGSILKNRPWYDEYMQLVNKILDGEPLTDEEQKRYDGFYEKEKEAREQYDNTEKIYLDDYVKDDELFKAYPELKQTRVVFEWKDGNESGSYSEKENVIRINGNSDIDAESTLVHEIQHSIQRIEGFSTGGNYKSVLNFFADHPEVEMNFVVNETYKEAQRKGIDVSKDELRRMFTESDDVAEGIENDVVERNGITESELGEIYNSGVDAGYRSISGEVEARNVQSRMGMTMNERLGSLAEETEDVAREDQIVLDRMVSHVMSMMEKKVNIEEVNKRFNEDIDGLTEENKDKVILSLGRPSFILRAAGIDDKPMKLYGNKVIKKMNKHGFKLEEIHDLPKAVADPIAVFNNYRKDGNRSVLTELEIGDKHILVSITLGKYGVDADFNIISSVFGKGGGNIVDWINKGYATYINKEKALQYLHFSKRNILEASNNAELSSAVKIVKDFENPKVSGVNLRYGDRLSNMVKETDNRKNDNMREQEEINRRFNEELDRFTIDNADNFVFSLGMPSNALLYGGIENKPIKLYGSKVAKKIRKHGFNSGDLKNLPFAVANPIAVFNNTKRPGNRSVLTELKTEKGNILVTLDLGKGMDADFDIVSSVFGKADNSIVHWINKGYATYINKEKALNYLHLSAPIAEASDNQELSSAVKIVKDFENPKVSGVNLRKVDRTASSSYEEMDILDRYMNETRNRILNSPAPVIAESGKDIYAEMPDLSPIQLSRVIVAANNKNVRAMYVPYTKQIVLLPKHGTAKEINDAYFHESVHFAVDMILPKGDEGRLTLERTGEEAKELDPRLAEWIDKNYNSNKSEEMVAHILENYFSYLDDKGKQDKLKAGVDFGSRYPVMNELSNNIINFLTTEEDGKIQSNGRRIERNASYDRTENKERSTETDTTALRGEQGEGEIKLAIKGKPRKKAGESEIEFYRRLREWEKQQEEIDKNSGTKAEPTTQYYTTLTEDLRRAQNRIDTQNIVINELEKLLKRHEEGKDVREAISSMVKKELSTGTISEFNKRELTSILSQMNKSVTGTKQEATEKAIMAIENIVNEAQARYVQRLIDRMLSLKIQDVNGKNMSIAKNVDDSTRKILSFIKGSASDLRTSGYEDEIRHLRSQNLSSRQDIEALERKIKLSDDDTEKEELQKEIDELNGIISANNEKLKDLNNEIESILKSKAEITDRDIETELDNLYEKMDRAAEGNAVWTISDNERMTSLLLMKQVRDYQKTDSQAVDIEDQIRQEFLNRTDLYRKRAKEAFSENRQKLTEAIKNKTVRIRALTESMNALKKQKVDMMVDFSEELRNLISGGKDSLRRKVEDEKERRGMLIINTLKDITGDKKINIFDDNTRTENWFKKAIFSPLYSFEFLAKIINVNTLGEDGFFYNYFVKGENGVIESYNTYQKGLEYARNQLDKKCDELFGKTFDKVSAESDNVVENSGVYITDDSSNQKYEKPLSKGQAMYIYMVWKMKDGRSKLELQGFTDDSIEDIKSFIGDKYVKLADWIQEELLPELREKYNQRYVEIYNTSLDKVDNYVPLRIRKEEVRQETKLSEGEINRNNLEARAGSLIRRVVNVKPVDITLSAFDVIMGHLNDMEEWYAFSRVRKDLDAVLSNNRIRNQINTNMNGMFKNLYEAAAVATRATTPKTGGFLDVALGKLSKGIIGGNIAFRVSTALKQVLSAPAFFGYSQSPLFMKEFVKSMSRPMETFKWSLENLPSFRERLRQNNAGNEKLNDDDKLAKWMEGYIKVGMYPNKMIDAITCATGAKAIYEYKLKRLTDSGTPREEAERMAKMDADIYYNATQQSSHSAFLSPMQMSRSAFDRLMTTYQNSNIGYVRKVVADFMDLKKSMDYNRLLNEYKRKYIDEGMTPEDAEIKAKERIYNSNKKYITGILLFGWGLNKLWELGSLGLLGFIHSDDGDTGKKNPLAQNITTYVTSPFRGLPMVNVVDNIVQGRDVNPVFVFDEINDFNKEAKEIAEMYGVLSPELAYSVLERSTTLSGVDLETWANVYTGVEDLVKNGATWDNALIDIMYVANFPRSNRLQVARELYKNADKEKYLERVSHAGNYIVPSAKLRTYIPGAIELSTTKAKDLEKQYELLNMTEEERDKYHALQTLTKVVLEDKELNKEWDENKDAETRREIAKKMYKNYSDEKKNKSIETLIGASSIVYVGPVSDKEENRYLELSSYDDIMKDIKLKGYIADKKEFSDQYNQLLKDGKKDEAEKYYNDNSDNIRLYKAAFKYGQRINKLKKSLNKGNDNDVIDEIRRTRNSFFDEFK